MALHCLRLRSGFRRVLSISSSILRQNPLLVPEPVSFKSLNLLSPASPAEFARTFTSTNSLLRKTFDPETDDIGPDTILFEGCDYNHWLITMDFPKDAELTREQMIEAYVNTAAQVFGSVEEAKKNIYALSTTTYQGFQVICSEETSEKFKNIPQVVFVLPDSYIDPVNKEYGGDKYVNGEIFPRPPPIHYRNTNRRRVREPQSSYGPPRQQNFGPPPPGQQSYGPPGQQSYGPPGQQSNSPPGQQNYGPPGQQSYGPPGQQSNSPPGQQNYGPPGQQSYGPPGQQSYGPPRQQNYGPSQQQNYGPPRQQNYGPPPQENYRAPAPQQNYGSTPHQQNYQPWPQQSNGSPSQQSFVPPQQRSYGNPNLPPQQNHGLPEPSNASRLGERNQVPSYHGNGNQVYPDNYFAQGPEK